jgi:hypothetical protein
MLDDSVTCSTAQRQRALISHVSKLLFSFDTQLARRSEFVPGRDDKPNAPAPLGDSTVHHEA